MYDNEKPGLRRLWRWKSVFFATLIATAATFGQLAAAYVYYLPGFGNLTPFQFLIYTVLRWLLLSLPSYMLSAYLEDHYATERNSRFLVTAIVSAVGILATVALDFTGFITGFLQGQPAGLFYSIAMTLLLVTPVFAAVSLLRGWNPRLTWIPTGLCGAAMVTTAVFSLLSGNLPQVIMACSYAALCAAYFLTFPQILTYVHPEEPETEEPTEKPIFSDEE